MGDVEVVDDRLRQMASLRVAVSDMEIAQAGARHLVVQEPDDRASDSGQALRHALMTGVLVSYARPWTTSRGDTYLFPLHKRARELEGEILPPRRTRERRLHNAIVELRNKVHAHTDTNAALRTPPTYLDVVLTFGSGALTDVFLGLGDETIQRIAQLADAQRRRFWTVIRRLGEELRAENGISWTALFDPSAQCAGGCGRGVGRGGRNYSIGPWFAPYCPECAQRDFH